jgi:hypothetical protein
MYFAARAKKTLPPNVLQDKSRHMNFSLAPGAVSLADSLLLPVRRPQTPPETHAKQLQKLF